MHKTFGNFCKISRNAQNFQKFLEISTKFWKFPKFSGNSQKNSGHCPEKNLGNFQKLSENFWKFPKVSGNSPNFRKFLEITKILRKFVRKSQEISQKNLGKFQEKIPETLQKFPEIPKTFRKSPKLLGNLQKLSGNFRTFLKFAEPDRNFQEKLFTKISRNFLCPPEISGNFRKA